MITIEQCRAARGLLNWTQQDLADAAGMSKTAINNFEKGHSDIKAESLKAIRMAFESADLEFLGYQGLRKKEEDAKIHKGPQGRLDLMDDVFETLRNYDSGLLIIHANQKSYQQLDVQAQLQARNIAWRMICAENIAPSSISPPDLCRHLPATDLQDNPVFLVYGHKIALELPGQEIIVVVNSSDAARAEKERFEFLWDKAEPEQKNPSELKKM